MPEEGIVSPELAAKIAELQRLDERDRQRSLARAEGELGPAPREFAPRPYRVPGSGRPSGMWGDTSETTLAVPSRSSYDMMSPQERLNSFGDAAIRGVLASMVAGGATATGLGWLSGPALAEAAAFPGMIGGGVAGATLVGPYGMVGKASDMAAGEVFRTPDTAGRFTPGPGMDFALRTKYDHPTPFSEPGALKSITPGEVEAAADRIEGERAAHQQRQEVLALQQQQEMAEYQRRLAEACAQEAARQSGLGETFGSPEERARTILALTDLGR